MPSTLHTELNPANQYMQSMKEDNSSIVTQLGIQSLNSHINPSERKKSKHSLH